MFGLRAARYQKGYSQEKLGVLAGLNSRIISEAERGVRVLSKREQNKVAEALELSSDDLVFGVVSYQIDGDHEAFDPDVGFEDIDDEEEDDDEEDDDDWA